MLESPKFIVNDNYNGSRAFTWLADLCGLSVDLINFLICQISALFLASLFRSILHPSKVSSAVRHTIALTLGLFFGYFCFGQQAIHIAGLPAACYIVIRTQSPAVVQRNVMLVAMTYLLCIHLIRQIYDYGSYSLDITGPLMIITQKVTSLAFSIHDGFMEHQKRELTESQQYHAIYKVPSALEYFSYVWHFQSLMAGPLVFYKDYIDFVEGYNFLKRSTVNGQMDNGRTELVLEPSPKTTVIKKVIGSMVCAFIFMKFVQMYPVKNMKDEDFLEHTSITYKFWYAMMATTCIRFKYYHAWLLAEAICNNSGLGFSGYNRIDGTAKWDLISNINVLAFEFAPNMRDAINNWNCGTNRWLRSIVYERVPKKYGTLLTFALSAVWHGFYPGYYLTFATGAVLVTAARLARRMFRHRLQQTLLSRMFYDILTCLTTRLVMGYATFPFVLLEFVGSIRLYLKFYLCLHIIALVTIFILPKFIRGEKRKVKHVESKTTTAYAIGGQPINNKEVANEHSTALTSDAELSDVLKDSKSFYEMFANYYANQFNGEHNTNNIPPKLLEIFKSISKTIPAYQIKHDQCEMEQLSRKLMEKIEAETKNFEFWKLKNFEVFIDEFIKDLMRDPHIYQRISKATAENLGKCNINACNNDSADESGAFLKKEIDVINAVVQQANVLPAVLSNGHAK